MASASLILVSNIDWLLSMGISHLMSNASSLWVSLGVELQVVLSIDLLVILTTGQHESENSTTSFLALRDNMKRQGMGGEPPSLPGGSAPVDPGIVTCGGGRHVTI